ncbi:uncharacterized protein MONOS_15587 [Monocercomonoides exilis]|uniref:uncharacterized protein n=1 Tax=Monocercomonoides exilis TaxID=2049356 RepID=UPI00355ABE09|nr:hypothetical protein MONOS_15587 [Monocercomonoides exilis]|eukprot:MONOS_15587.1-p1 / transcript=MONOS_15587.1 / gene=MONOS_15587 / organism=Monocercomonoides_exilis_PA203 / gene_product=unspecified product / transcript_product=unspecified product / location=Mono_scaffold01280:11605-11928(-) / protein_length=108 / sequence_SO=supercontig / SO=protein_coding / is_pseudo=false
MNCIPQKRHQKREGEKEGGEVDSLEKGELAGGMRMIVKKRKKETRGRRRKDRRERMADEGRGMSKEETFEGIFAEESGSEENDLDDDKKGNEREKGEEKRKQRMVWS